MPQEICPRCNSLQNMTVSKSTMEKADSNGEVTITVFTAYHCEICQSFVYSETEETTGPDTGIDYYNPL